MKQSEPFELFPWQKRQAALLYHFASLEYLRGLKPQIEELIAWTDAVLSERTHLDSLGRAELNWAPSDTAANFSTYAFPALQEFLESTVWHIAQRMFENYGITGAYQCARMLQEYAGQMIWATYEQEDEFKERFDRIYKYAEKIDRVMRRPPTADDSVFKNLWSNNKELFPRLPRFRVRTDVEGCTDRIPPRTGVYVPQDDPYGALQFRWAGGGYGELCECVTPSELGLKIISVIGRENPWADKEGLLRFSQRSEYRGVFKDRKGNELTASTSYVVLKGAFTQRPCKWYFVELMNDQFEDHDGSYAGVSESAEKPVQRRMPAETSCPRAGWWHTPAKAHSRRYFKQGEVFPKIEGSDYGETFWLWSQDQTSPSS